MVLLPCAFTGLDVFFSAAGGYPFLTKSKLRRAKCQISGDKSLLYKERPIRRGHVFKIQFLCR
jgi:hypothetical protein